ncbi:RNA polymerase I-associated factor PAF67-domain-containing protein [Syncephalis pseudoplumigaleata]|uniref:Eukaryotic translation initiation factor 3 subunit L n=1 Tax=Syncephalis pseudoplumigaleata TaxID=1712513 RepID=A0A4P9Z1H8_9FUNG|nr:RNA polymerase I-associated factor PAF67-domain-containing protein [Syncephalis pseudoplumigaleata]|eukprot:RKP26165.1 RNA polymerase I-associated factor PAF67-domain-containing protein [Syncephalis pseudoplumigaleata]
MSQYNHQHEQFDVDESTAQAVYMAATYAGAEEYDEGIYGEYDAEYLEQHQLQIQQQLEIQQQLLEQVPDVVRNFVVLFHQALTQHSGRDVHQFYEQTFKKLSERFYQHDPWPEAACIAPLVDHDEIFLALYDELCFRHVYARLQPTLEQRYRSFSNYCALFNHILNVEEPIGLELPNQWLWDIIDEFIYQYESFCRYRNRVERLSDEERAFLAENADVWNTFSVLNVLYSLIQKSNINAQLDAIKAGKDPNEVAGAFGEQPLYKMLGYFSLVGLLRVHCMIGDYTLALQMLDHVDMSRKAMFTKVIACHVSSFYYIGFAYMMMGRYTDAIKNFAHILVFISRARQFNTRSYQYDQINKKTEQLYALLAICISLCPTRLDDTVHNTLRDKQGDHLNRMQKGDSVMESFQELFLYACPKFISPIPPNYAALAEEAAKKPEDSETASATDASEAKTEAGTEAPQGRTPEAPSAYQCKIFLGQIKQHIVSTKVRSFLKICTTLPVTKLASFLDLTPEELTTQLMVLKGCSRQTRWVDGVLTSGERVPVSDVDFCIKQDSIQVAEHKVGRRYGDWFVRNVGKVEDILAKFGEKPSS